MQQTSGEADFYYSWNVQPVTWTSLSSFSSLIRSALSDSSISDAWVDVVFSSARSAVSSTTYNTQLVWGKWSF